MRDLNPHARMSPTSTYAGQGTESEHQFGSLAALEAPSSLQSVPNGNRPQEAIVTDSARRALDTPTRRTWRTLFILSQLTVAAFLALAFLFGTSDLALFFAILSAAMSAAYIALRA